MSYRIEERTERKRGCGFRKPGGLYLVSGGLARPCGKLPIPLETCPTCGGGIKFCRSWTWIRDLPALTARDKCNTPAYCLDCPFGGSVKRAGLLWIGAKFYPVREFTREVAQMGVSRRITAIPREFVLGETWVLLAHKQAVPEDDGEGRPGIFHAFKPTAIEYVVKDDDPEEKLERLAERGITLVRVKHAEEGAQLHREAM